MKQKNPHSFKHVSNSLFITSWNATFAPRRNKTEDVGHLGRFYDFIGLPEDPSNLSKMGPYILLLGPVVVSIKNLIKLMSELPLGMATLYCYQNLLNSSYDRHHRVTGAITEPSPEEKRKLNRPDWSLGPISFIGRMLLWAGLLIFGTLFYYVRSVTSPIKSAKHAFKQGNKFLPGVGYFLAFFSIASSLISYAALMFLMSPVLVVIGMHVGITTAASAPGWLLTLGGPLSNVLISLGIVSVGSSFLTAAAGIVTLVGGAFLLNGIREYFLGSRGENTAQAAKSSQRTPAYDPSGSDSEESGLGSDDDLLDEMEPHDWRFPSSTPSGSD